jgi:hypothetical protein
MNNYEEEMLKAFVNKPEKYEWYKYAFNQYDLNGTPTMKWVWSWWAFFGGAAFLLYRKTYLAALIVFMISVVLSVIPIIGFIFAILVGGYGTYSIYKRYINKKLEIESKITDENERILAMQEIGGYNQWVVWFYYLLLAITIIGIIAATLIPAVST